MIMLSNGDILLTRSEVSAENAEKYPEILIENNIEEIRQAALTSMRCLLLITNYLQLLSFNELFETATEQLASKTKELEDDLLTELPDISAHCQTITSVSDGESSVWDGVLDFD